MQPLSIFADEATEGFIVFTLGSVVPVSSLPKHIIQTFLNVFAKLPLRVVWRWDAPIPDDTPSNIMMVKWLPQQDLLGKHLSFIGVDGSDFCDPNILHY